MTKPQPIAGKEVLHSCRSPPITSHTVIPAKAGIPFAVALMLGGQETRATIKMDPGLRRDDGCGEGGEKSAKRTGWRGEERVAHLPLLQLLLAVIPAKAGIPFAVALIPGGQGSHGTIKMDPGLRRDDGCGEGGEKSAKRTGWRGEERVAHLPLLQLLLAVIPAKAGIPFAVASMLGGRGTRGTIKMDPALRRDDGCRGDG